MYRSNLGDTSEFSDEYNLSVNKERRSARISNSPQMPSTSAQAAQQFRASAAKAKSRRKPPKTYHRRELKTIKTMIKLQNTTNFLIARAPFGRVVREITMNLSVEVNRYTLQALQALQEAAEMFIVKLFQDSYLLTLHRQRVTLSVSDVQLLRVLKLNF